MKLRRTGDFHTAVLPRPSLRATLPRASRHGQGGVRNDPSAETQSPSAVKSMFPKMPLGNGARSLEPSASQVLPPAVPGAGSSGAADNGALPRVTPGVSRPPHPAPLT